LIEFIGLGVRKRAEEENSMPQTPHIEQHFTAGETVRDIVIGMSDGLTVPFALAAGLSGAVSSAAIIVTAGLAEIAAGSIAMGLGGYLAARSDAEHYASERRREQQEVKDKTQAERTEVADVFTSYGLTPQESAPIVEALSQRPEAWVDFMMRFELGLEAPDPKRALTSALTIAGSYIAGGLIPLLPYIVLGHLRSALVVSVIVTLLALLVFGYVKGHFTGASPIRSGLQTMLIGGLAAAAAFGIARLISR
jgi:vacuolar iron transporter family protein